MLNSLSLPVGGIFSLQTVERFASVVFGLVTNQVDFVAEMTIQIENVTVAVDRILLEVNVDRRVFGGYGRCLHVGERASVNFAYVVFGHSQPLELVQIGKHSRRQKLKVVVGHVENAQMCVLLKVVLSKRQTIARQVQELVEF